jgi:hypothetical protein
MRIVAPLAYSVRYIPKNGSKERTEAFVDLIEWNIPEVSNEDAPLAIEARTPIASRHGTMQWAIKRWKLFEGGLIRTMSNSYGNVMAAENLPQWKNGRIRSNFNFEFLGALGLNYSQEHYNLAQDAIMGRESFERQSRKLPQPDRIISSDREEALAVTQRILRRFVIIDGLVWKKTREPLIRVSISNIELMMSEIDYGEWDEVRFATPPSEIAWSMNLPLLDHGRIAEIELDRRLHAMPQVAVDEISEDAPITRDVSLWHARRAAENLLAKTEHGIGSEKRQTVENWVALRELSRDEDATSVLLTDAVIALKLSLSNRYKEVRIETDWLLKFTEPSGQASAAVAALKR